MHSFENHYTELSRKGPFRGQCYLSPLINGKVWIWSSDELGWNEAQGQRCPASQNAEGKHQTFANLATGRECKSEPEQRLISKAGGETLHVFNVDFWIGFSKEQRISPPTNQRALVWWTKYKAVQLQLLILLKPALKCLKVQGVRFSGAYRPEGCPANTWTAVCFSGTSSSSSVCWNFGSCYQKIKWAEGWISRLHLRHWCWHARPCRHRRPADHWRSIGSRSFSSGCRYGRCWSCTTEGWGKTQRLSIKLNISSERKGTKSAIFHFNR